MFDEKKSMSFEEIAATASEWAKKIPLDAPGDAPVMKAILVLVSEQAARSVELKAGLATMNRRLTESIAALEQRIADLMAAAAPAKPTVGVDGASTAATPITPAAPPANGSASAAPPGISVPPMPPGVTVSVKS